MFHKNKQRLIFQNFTHPHFWLMCLKQGLGFRSGLLFSVFRRILSHWASFFFFLHGLLFLTYIQLSDAQATIDLGKLVHLSSWAMVGSAVQWFQVLESPRDFDTFYCGKCTSSKPVFKSLCSYMLWDKVLTCNSRFLCIQKSPASASLTPRLEICVTMSFVSFPATFEIKTNMRDLQTLNVRAGDTACMLSILTVVTQ